MFSSTTRKDLRQWLSDPAIDDLEQRIAVIVRRPPPKVPTLKQAREQLQALDEAASALHRAIEAAPWTVGALSAYQPGKFQGDIFLGRLENMRTVILRANADLKGKASNRGNKADAMVREIIRQVLDVLALAKVRHSVSPTGPAASCSQAVINGIVQNLDGKVPARVVERLSSVNAAEQVRAMLGKPRIRKSKPTMG